MTKRLVLWALGWYRQYRGLRPDACRFDPTCSAYCVEAVQRHGVAKGLFLALRRVSRCHPLGGSGYDPVPEPGGRSPLHPAGRRSGPRLLTPLPKRQHHA